MTTPLTHQKCVPCEGGTAPLTDKEEELYHEQTKDWTILREGVHKIEKEFVLKNFSAAVEFINNVAKIAESEGHHPDMLLFDYKHVKLTLFTHAIGGLSVNDFIIASKVDELL